MKVVLVTCPAYGVLHPPLSLALLSASLKERGHEVHTLDLNIQLFNTFPDEKKETYWNMNNAGLWQDRDSAASIINKKMLEGWLESLIQLEADIVGFSVYSTNLVASLMLAEKLKTADSRIKTIFGGPFCRRDNGIAGTIIKYSYVDSVVVGEGEITLWEIADSYEQYGKVKNCKGAIVKSEGRVMDYGERQPVEDLDSLPIADFSGFDFSVYKEKLAPLLASRGCLYNCAFCNEKSFWHDYRNRSADNILSEIRQVIAQYGITTFRFNDLLLNGNLPELEKLCDMLVHDNINIQWGGYITVRKMERSLIAKMKRSGCYFVFAGIESGSQKMLNKFKKGVSLETAENLIRLFSEEGIQTQTGWIVGFPDESAKDFEQTVDFIKRNHDFIDRVAPASLFTIPPGSPISEHPELFGIKKIIHDGDYVDATTNLELRQSRINFFNKRVAYDQKVNLS